MKRTSDHQLTKDNADQADAAAEEPEHGFDRAPPQVLAKRRFLKAKRTTHLRQHPAAPAPNPFANLPKPPDKPPPQPVHAPAHTPAEEPAEEPAEKPADKPPDATQDTPPQRPAPASAEKGLTTPAEKPTTEPNPDSPPNATHEKPTHPTQNNPTQPSAETPAPPSGRTNRTAPTEAHPPSASQPPNPEPASAAPSIDPNAAPSAQPKPTPTPPVSAPQPTPAPLKPNAPPANGAPKPAIIFGATTKPVTFASAAQSDGFTFKVAEAAPAVVEKKPQFKETAVVTGEENDTELFRTRAKLYALETRDSASRWKERGVGALKLNKNTETGKARLLMRTEATLRVVLNTPVFKALQIDRATDKSIRFQGFDVDDDKKSTSFLARFTAKDATSDMIDAIEKCKNDLQ